MVPAVYYDTGLTRLKGRPNLSVTEWLKVCVRVKMLELEVHRGLGFLMLVVGLKLEVRRRNLQNLLIVN